MPRAPLGELHGSDVGSDPKVETPAPDRKERPDFDPAESAFYYGRVIEIPTPRWTAYDARHYAVKFPAEVPMVTTDRGYTSPI